MILNDTLLEIELSSRLANIRFEIADAEGPVESVQVELDGNLSLQSGSDGIVTFINLLAREKHEFVIMKDGYETVTDSLFLEIDTVVSVLLQTPNRFFESGDPGFEVYPVPAKNELIITGLTDQPGVFWLVDMEGKVRLVRNIQEENRRLDVQNIPDGLYVLRIKTNTGVESRHIVISKN